MAGIKINKDNCIFQGTCKKGREICFSIPVDKRPDKIILYSQDDEKEFFIDEKLRTGGLYSFKINGTDTEKYRIVSNKKEIKDDFAKVLCGNKGFGKSYDIQYRIYEDDFIWRGDRRPGHEFSDMIIYRLNVRGFTNHISSCVKNPGTFNGVVEKIPYLKDLGINTVELMPCYEFDEIIKEGNAIGKINVLGYGDGHYYAPKESYSSKKNGGQVNEFKNMVKELHKAGIEVIMDFYFKSGTNPYLVMDCLRFWVREYHIDGIHLDQEAIPYEVIKKDPVLYDIKIMIDSYEEVHNEKNVISSNDKFMISARKFVKSDEDIIKEITDSIRKKKINYVSAHNTFTLMDSVSYERKHNEKNGENNTDGLEVNYSWNCGCEGPTKRKKINELRKKQIKNLIALLFISQGIPSLYYGDEMCRSQKGNNNPYCQDNEITWLNWDLLNKNMEIFQFTKSFIKFRKEHSILHKISGIQLIDYKGIGCPDMSFHGVEPWRTDFSHMSRQFALLYNGNYGDKKEKSIYGAFNMYWEDTIFNIPAIDKNNKWKIIYSTDEKDGEISSDRKIILKGRSVVIFED